MATLTLRPTGDTYSIGLLATAADHYSCIDESVANDADYVWYNSSDLYTWQNHTTETGAINSVTIYGRAKYIDNDAPANPTIQFWDSKISGWTTAQNLTTSYALYSAAFTGTWSWTDIDNLATGLKLTRTVSGFQAGTPYCSQLYIVVDYTEPSGRNQSVIVG